MQAVYVLGNQRERGYGVFEFRERIVRGVGRRLGNPCAPPVIPFPNEPRIARKGLWRCQVFGTVLPPEAARTPEHRYTAFRRDSGAGECGDVRGARQPLTCGVDVSHIHIPGASCLARIPQPSGYAGRWPASL